MAEFKIIETQEELDKIIGERISRERKSMSDKYADYDDLKQKASDLEAQVNKLSIDMKGLEDRHHADVEQINGLSSKVAKYETDSVKTRIAIEMGLPYELSNRLNGETEEDIRKDAENMKGFMNLGRVAPTASTETPPPNAKISALMELSKNLK